MKTVTYILPYSTESDIRKANKKRQFLYTKYNNVQVYPNGFHEVKIVASNQLI